MILGRRIMNQALTMFLPAIIICVVCYSTNFFRVCCSLNRLCIHYSKYGLTQASNFEAAIGVNASALVTLATLFTSAADRLPNTSYLKLIDFW